MDFLKELFEEHQSTEDNPHLEEVIDMANNLLNLLFPDRCPKGFRFFNEFQHRYEAQKVALIGILRKIDHKLPKKCIPLADEFFNRIPEIHRKMKADAKAIAANDPAARDVVEVIKTYPGFYAIAMYRIAHELWKLEIPYVPRVLTESAHRDTGIDIHPGAHIGSDFVIDHGTGIVIGETCHIGNHVKLYQNVTLGALSVSKDQASTKRHPSIEDNVVIYSGATILGGNTIIGKNTVIGGNVWLTSSVPANSKVFNKAQVTIQNDVS